jgi:biopolymer transport protein ExbB
MFEIVQAGGWLMVPILACAIGASAIVLERLWALQQRRVVPPEVTEEVARWVQRTQLDDRHIEMLRESSPLGQVLAAGIAQRHASREVIKESIEDSGRHVVHELESFLNTLGTIAAITPLLGLLGTVSGMIKAFTAITTQGVGNPTVLAGGIAEALITTAAGLAIAIPSVIAYRYLRGRVNRLVVLIEKESIQLVDALTRGERAALHGMTDEAAKQPLKRRA